METKDDQRQTDFQARASEEGRDAQEKARRVLETCGFAIIKRNHRLQDVGVTVNVVATNAHGRKWYFMVSGAFTSERAGLKRTDTVFKVLGKSSVLTELGVDPVVLLTTNLPHRGSGGDKALRTTHGRTFFDAVEMFSSEGRRRLRTYARADAVTCPLPGFWSLEELYGPTLREPNPLGAPRSAPLRMTGDPFGIIGPDARVRSMPHRLKIFVPSESRTGQVIPEDQRRLVLEQTKRDLTGIGGGSTSYEAQGHWVDPLGGIADERVLVLETYFSHLPSPDAVKTTVRRILEDLDQNAVAIVLDDRMYQFLR